MNMKLLAGLAVVITLASAMTFIGLSSKTRGSAVPATKTSSSSVQAVMPAATAGDPAATSGEASLNTQVKVGGDVVKTTVTVE